jgi:hypothetical protein
MSSEYVQVLRNQNQQIFGATGRDNVNPLVELSLLRNALLHNLRNGAVRAEIHDVSPEETFIQAIERIGKDNPKPAFVVTKDDLSEQEIATYS